MNEWVETARRVASEEVGRMATNRWGIVAAVDPQRRAVRVRLMPEDVLSGWLPVLQQGAGTNWSMSVIPEVGWQAFVLPEMGNGMSMVVMGFASPVSAPAPETASTIGTGGIPRDDVTPARPGEVVITGPGGTVVRLTSEGKVYIRAAALEVDGDLFVNGEVRDKSGFLSFLRDAYNAHVHPDAHGGDTGTTSEPANN